MTTTATKAKTSTKSAASKRGAAAAETAAIATKTAAEIDERNAAAARLEKTTVAPIDNKVDRYAAAKVEAEKVKTWEKNGRKGTRPTTVNYDAILVENGSGGQPKATSRKAKTTSRPKVETTVMFFYGANDMSKGRHNRLSALAARNKLSSEQLRKMLDAAKIIDPETTRWSLTLPSGVVIGARLKGDPMPTKPAKAQKTSKTTKAAKAPAAKTSKTTAKQVTPLPKKQTAKRTTSTGTKTATEIGKQATAAKAVANRRNARKSA